jgi:hypothetical protein
MLIGVERGSALNASKFARVGSTKNSSMAGASALVKVALFPLHDAFGFEAQRRRAPEFDKRQALA